MKGSAAGGKRGPGLTLIVKYITGEMKPQMPMGQPPLPAEQLALVRDWVAAGGRDDTPAEARETVSLDKPVVYTQPPVVTAVAFSPDGKMLAVSGNREILLHTLDGSAPPRRLSGLSERLLSLAFSRDGSLLAASGGTPARFGEIQLWDVASGKLRRSMVLTGDTVFGVSLSPDGTRLAAGCTDNTVRIVDTVSGKELSKMGAHENWVLGTVFGADGKRIVSVGRDRSAKLTDAASGAFQENVNLLRGELTAIARHPSKEIVVIGGDERVPYIYMMDRPKNMKIADDTTLLRKLPRQEGAIAALAWSPDGRRIAVAGAAPEVNVYDPETGAVVAQCKGHKAGIYTVAFSPDSSVVAAARVRRHGAALRCRHRRVEKRVCARSAANGIRRDEGAAMRPKWDRRSVCVVCQPDASDARQGRKTSVTHEPAESRLQPRLAAPRVFHEVSRAERPSQQTTKGDGLYHLALLVIFAANAALAATPVITELKPRGAEIGRPFTLTAIGRNLAEGARVTTTLPASFTLVTPAQTPGMMPAPGRSLTFLVEPGADTAPGVYPIRIETPSGISNILLFTLGTFPEVTEEESQPNSPPNRNDSIETAEPVRSSPVVVNGTLRGPERDVFRVSGKAGERRVFEVEARRCGSAIDPVLRILDAAGKQLARSDDSPGTGLDARIDFTFPTEGSYYVEVTDARFSTQVQNFYRLKMGAYRYADGIFPLGGRRGAQTEVTFFGAHAGAGAHATVDLRKADAAEAFTRVALPDSPALPFLFAVSDLPELLEPVEGMVPIPSVVNGRLEKDGEVDRYRVKVEPGEKLLIELQARELGTSRLEAILTAYDAKGKKLDSAGDQPLPEDVFAIQGTSRTSSDPFLNLTVPADVHEIVLTVDDLARRGGPAYGYRLITRRQAEDFRLSLGSPFLNLPAGGTVVISVSADRRGFDGPIQLKVADLPKGIRVDGGTIPREYVDAGNTRTFNRRGILTLTAEQGAALNAGQLQIWGEGTLADGTVLRRRARGSGMVIDVAGATEQGVVDRQRPVTAPWLGLDLPVAVSDAAAATLEVRQTNVKQMEEGARYEYAYQWKIKGRATPPAQVGVDVIGAKDIRVIDMKAEPGAMSGTFAVTTTKATDPARYDLYINGRVKTDDGDESIVSRAIPFEVSGGTPSVASNQR